MKLFGIKTYSILKPENHKIWESDVMKLLGIKIYSNLNIESISYSKVNRKLIILTRITKCLTLLERKITFSKRF